MHSSAPSPIHLPLADDMSYDKPDFQNDLLFTEQSDPNSLFPYDDPKCIDPDMMNLFTVDDPTSRVFPSPPFASEELQFNSPPPPSTSSESDDLELSYDVDGLMSPISRGGSIDARPLPEPRAPKRRPTFSHHTRERNSNRNSKHPTGKRVPHNIVERKYRNTLNSEMERLRCAIPHIAHLGVAADAPVGSSQGSKPSKANILASAVAYIRNMEMECDRLNKKNDELQAALNLAFSRGRLP